MRLVRLAAPMALVALACAAAPLGSARGSALAAAQPAPGPPILALSDRDRVAAPAAPGAARNAVLEATKARALAYFTSPRITPDPGWLSLFGYMHRRFGLVVPDAAGTPLHTVRAGVARPEVFAVYRRIDDPSARVEKRQIAELPTAIDRITASALHCDRIALPDDWVQILLKATRAGAYALTHAVLAAEWSVENGCLERAEMEDLHRQQELHLVELVARRDELATRYAAATDIWIEAIAMLYYSRAGARVRDEWIDSLLAAQRPDGGWPRGPAATRSDPHATALALWIVLENLDPAPPIAWIRRS